MVCETNLSEVLQVSSKKKKKYNFKRKKQRKKSNLPLRCDCRLWMGRTSWKRPHSPRRLEGNKPGGFNLSKLVTFI